MPLKKMIICTLMMSSAGSFVNAMDSMVMEKDGQNESKEQEIVEEGSGCCECLKEVCCSCTVEGIPFCGLLRFWFCNVFCRCLQSDDDQR